MGKETCRRLMEINTRRILTSFCEGFLILSLVAIGHGQTPTPAYKAIGAVVSVDPTGFTLQTDSGTRLTVLLPNTATVLRVAPDQKDLKSATKIKAEDICVIVWMGAQCPVCEIVIENRKVHPSRIQGNPQLPESQKFGWGRLRDGHTGLDAWKSRIIKLL